jgi:putative phosphotransacetylase
MHIDYDGEIPVEISARHVHLSQADQDALFGDGYEMKVMKSLSQTGQYAAEEKVTVVGPKGELECRVLGPCRKQTQVELAVSDGVRLGIMPTVRLSGDLAGSAGCSLVGPKGRVDLKEGVINDVRHLHISDKEAEEWKVKDGDVISARVDGETPVTFHAIRVRIHPSFRLNIHLDTDEGNAAALPKGGGIAKLLRERDDA